MDSLEHLYICPICDESTDPPEEIGRGTLLNDNAEIYLERSYCKICRSFYLHLKPYKPEG